MPRMRVVKGAYREGAPFLFLALALFGGAEAGTLDCPAGRFDDNARVEHVYDGDTVRLVDGRKVRFIGINTPEIGHDGERSEPFAEAARTEVEHQLKTGGERLKLRIGREQRDRYGRLLAHPFLPDGTSLNGVLLQKGLATTLAVPPNLWNQECYRALERRARDTGAGIWTLARYQVVDSRKLAPGVEGYRLVAGRVERIGESRRSFWVELEGDFAVRIPRSDRHEFGPLERMVGQRVVARGWVRSGRHGLKMTVRYPADLNIPER